MTINLPAWLDTLILSLAAYFKGRADQKAVDESAEQVAEAHAEQTAEQQRAAAEALDHEQIAKEVQTWTAP